MLTVYLDQMHWIELAAVEAGTHRHASTPAVLAALTDAVERGEVRLPLSSVHYMELHHRVDDDRRRLVGRIMYDLSRSLRIASPITVLRSEIANAIHAIAHDSPTTPRTTVFVDGATHILTPSASWMDAATADTVDEHLLSGKGQRFVDLVGTDTADATRLGPFDQRATSAAWVERQTRIAEQLHEHRWLDRPKVDELACQLFLTNFHQPVQDALLDTDLPARLRRVCFEDAPINELRALHQDIYERCPSAVVHCELEVHQHKQARQRPWHPHDHNDLTALATAIAYCDLVVTERHWTHAARTRLPRINVDADHVLPTLEQLGDRLAAST